MDINDIKPINFYDFPVWKDSDNDDDTIEPLTIMSEFYDNSTIVKTEFTDSVNKKYIGYIYYNTSNRIDRIFPVMFIDESGDKKIFFWNCLVKPTIEEVINLRENCTLPIYYKTFSCNEFEQLSGIIEGFYYLDKSNNYVINVVSS